VPNSGPLSYSGKTVFTVQVRRTQVVLYLTEKQTAKMKNKLSLLPEPAPISQTNSTNSIPYTVSNQYGPVITNLLYVFISSLFLGGSTQVSLGSIV